MTMEGAENAKIDYNKLTEHIKSKKEYLLDILRHYGVKIHGDKYFHCYNVEAHKNRDKHPSAGIYRSKNGFYSWKCHGCLASGSAIDVVVDHENCTFKEAVLIAASILHIDLTKFFGEYIEEINELNKFRVIKKHIVEFLKEKFEQINPEKTENGLIIRYKQPDILWLNEKYGFVTASFKTEELVGYLLSKKVPLEDIERIVFGSLIPIVRYKNVEISTIFPFYKDGNVCGFVINNPGVKPKYINSANSKVFDKSKDYFSIVNRESYRLIKAIC